MIVIFPNAHDPIERIVGNGIDVHGHRLRAAQDPQRAADDVVVVHQIIIDEKALIGVPAPYPAVALNPVEKALARIQVQRIGGHLPDFVD